MQIFVGEECFIKRRCFKDLCQLLKPNVEDFLSRFRPWQTSLKWIFRNGLVTDSHKRTGVWNFQNHKTSFAKGAFSDHFRSSGDLCHDTNLLLKPGLKTLWFRRKWNIPILLNEVCQFGPYLKVMNTVVKIHLLVVKKRAHVPKKKFKYTIT